MIYYYVATVARYVIVRARNEEEARDFGEIALRQLNPNLPTNILTIREATRDEIELSL